MLAYYFFMIFCLKLGFNRHVKEAECIFYVNSYYAQNGVNGGILGPKINILKLFLKFDFRFFQNCAT